MNNGDALLKLSGVSKVFARGSVDEVFALRSIDLEVRPKDFITLIGSNGSGKTTMLNIISGVFPPERGGKIVISGKEVTNLSEHRRARYVGRVFQDPQTGTAANMTIEENLSLAILRGQTRGLSVALNKKLREQFHRSLEPLGLKLEDRLNAPVGTLSGGQRQALSGTIEKASDAA